MKSKNQCCLTFQCLKYSLSTREVGTFRIYGPQGFTGSGEKRYLFSGNREALVIILVELGSKLLLWGFREPCQKVKR